MLQTVNGKTMLTDEVYAWGKKAVQIYIPAVSTLYFTLGSVWGLPAVEQVIGTLAALAVFIGAVLGFSSKNFDDSGAAHDGEMVATTKPDGQLAYSFNFNGDPHDIVNQESVSFKVVPPPDPQALQGNPPSDS